MNDTEEAIQELVEAQTILVKTIIANDELRYLNAQVIKLSFDSFIAQDFSREEAIQLVAASIKSTR